MSPMLMERFEFPLNSSQIMGSSLFSACSHTDSRHGAMFPGMQTVTEAVTFFSIFTLRSKVMTIPYGARLYPRLAEAIGFCHSTILFPIIIHKMRRAERSWGGGRNPGYDLYDLVLGALPVHSAKCTEPRTGYMVNITT